MEEIQSISPKELEEKLAGGQLGDAMLIDVREHYEWDYYRDEQAVHLPMNSIPARLEELPRDRTLYIVCAHGVRSAHVCMYLMRQGFTHAVNVEGGMAAIASLRGFAYD